MLLFELVFLAIVLGTLDQQGYSKFFDNYFGVDEEEKNREINKQRSI